VANARGLLVLALGLSLAIACAPTPAAPPAAATRPPAPPASSAAPSPAAQAGPAAPAALSPPVTVKIGTNAASLTPAGSFIALEKGYFAEVGLVPEFVQIRTSQETIPPLATGEIDVGQGALSAATYNALGRDIPLRLVADSAYSPPGYDPMAFVVRKELWDSGAFQGYGDLRGKRVATGGGGSVSQLALDTALHRAGLDSADVETTTLSFADMNVALSNGSVDVGVQIEPSVAAGLARDLFVLYRWTDDVLPPMQFSAVMYSPPFRANREVANRFMLAYLRGVRDYVTAVRTGEGKAAVVQALIKNTAVKDPALYDQMRYLLMNPNGRLDVDNLVWQVARYYEGGWVREPLDIAALVDHSYADWAVAQLGPAAQ